MFLIFCFFKLTDDTVAKFGMKIITLFLTFTKVSNMFGLESAMEEVGLMSMFLKDAECISILVFQVVGTKSYGPTGIVTGLRSFGRTT